MAEATWHPSASVTRLQPSRVDVQAGRDALSRSSGADRPARPDPSRNPDERFTDLDGISAHWRSALDVAHAAVVAAGSLLPPAETHVRNVRLVDERKAVAHLLEALARDQRSGARLWAVAPWDGRRLLGLSPNVMACVFNLDGVLIGSAAVHAAAWAETFDEFIASRIERTGGLFAPFNPRTNYYRYMHGRPRLEGVRAFLASRGISLPEGTPRDAPGTETVHGLANRKGEALTQRLAHEGPRAFAGSHRYLELAREAGLRCGIVSASANARTILEHSGLSGFIDECIDGNTMASDHLRAKPAPDTLLAACRQLGVTPQNAASFETTPAGVSAARTAGFGLIIGVDSNGQAATLRDEGADVVITGLAELLDRDLAA